MSTKWIGLSTLTLVLALLFGAVMEFTQHPSTQPNDAASKVPQEPVVVKTADVRSVR